MSDTAPEGIALSDELTARINTSLADGLPILVAYVNSESQARLSFRGSAHVHSPDQLGFWARKAEGGVVEGIASNPKVTLMYRDPATRTMIFFYGRAHAATDQATIDRLYDESPEPERNADPEKKGVGIVVDLDVVQGRTPDGPLNLTRA
jgi:hypothetical protein